MGLNVDIIKKYKNFQLQIQAAFNGKVTGILGASGSGKTLLLKTIAGIESPDSGTIINNTVPYFNSAERINIKPQKRMTGYVFQNYALFPNMTVKENILFALDKNKKSLQKTEMLIKKFHLTGQQNQYPGQLSGGQQQRTALARALAVEPDILLLDEPFSALDDHLRTHMIKEMKDIVDEFNGKVLLVTHNIDEAYRMCDELLVMEKGHVSAFGTKEDIFKKPPTLEAAILTGCKNISEISPGNDETFYTEKWKISLQTKDALTGKTHAGIRAHHVKLSPVPIPRINSYPCFVKEFIETPFRVTVYLILDENISEEHSYHLQCEISREDYEILKTAPMPWYIHIDPKRLFLV